jgi:hypothetical protein
VSVTMSEGCEPFVVEPGWVDAYFVKDVRGAFYRLLTYADGTVRFEHRCDRGDRGTIICAPALQIGNGHTLTWRDVPTPDGTYRVPAPTVTPSILCPDCGTHGFVTDGRWSS